jgi:DNA invertase Pin-like site-specific DNA recombinase
VQDGIDPATSTGRLMLNMLATLAEYDRELITERINAGIAALTKPSVGQTLGLQIGGHAWLVIIPATPPSLSTTARMVEAQEYTP